MCLDSLFFGKLSLLLTEETRSSSPWLGGVIVNGELYKALLHIYDDGEVFLDFFHDYNIAIKVDGDQDGD